MKPWRWMNRLSLVIMTLGCLLVSFGCEGTETRNQVDDTVETLAGQKQVTHMKEMKEDLDRIQTQQSQRLDQLEEAQ